MGWPTGTLIGSTPFRLLESRLRPKVCMCGLSINPGLWICAFSFLTGGTTFHRIALRILS